jgi:membrane-bound serine protease (ClpP class)
MAESLEALDPVGTVRVHGEVWNAQSVSGNIAQGQKVRITRIENLKLFVEQVKSSQPAYVPRAGRES